MKKLILFSILFVGFSICLDSFVNAQGVGINSGGAVDEYFNGKIDEVGIWTRTLTSTEITTLYNSGNGLQHPF